MKRTLSLALALGVLVACGKKQTGNYDALAPAAQLDNAALVKAGAEALWNERGDAEKLKQALVAYEQIVAADPTDRDAYAHLVRGYYFLGDGHLQGEENLDARLAAWDVSINWSKKCLALNSEFTGLLAKGDETEASAARAFKQEDVPCVYWGATSLGKWARAQGLGTLLRYKDQAYAWMMKVHELAPDYYFTASTRYLAAYHAVAPDGVLTKSKEYFDQAIAAYPNHFGNRVLYAESYAVKAQNKALFEEQLNFVINGDPNSIPEIKPEQEAEQRKAKALLAQKDDLFAE